MGYLFQWPYTRTTYDGIDNPIYDQDIQVAMEAVLQALVAISGLQPGDFAIITGFIYDGSTNYTKGIFYLNGTFYFMENGITTGQCVKGIIVAGLSEPFDDGNTRPIYMLQEGTVANAYVAGTTSPVFAGDMTNYRCNVATLRVNTDSLLATQAELQDAAFLEVGNVSGTVMAGDDPRAPYTAVQLDARYAQIANVLLKLGPAIYTPTTPGDPLCKGYADATYIPVLAKGFSVLGNADPSGGTNHTFSLGLTLPSNFYHVELSLESNSANPANDTYWQLIVRNKTTSSFDVYFRQGSGATQNVTLVWRITPE